EAELLYHLSECINRIWSLLQWWASISFGLLLVAHFASDRLNTYLVILLSLLYLGFTGVMLQIVGKNYGIAESVYADLERLLDENGALSSTAIYWLDNRTPSIEYLLPMTLGGTFLGVLGYLLYSYWRSRN
ncbi:MAG: hypothetical protein R3228_18690, partial [Halioglobus sp.]|nr:hypothetical protein [Halioglobus sp.]